MPSTTLVLKQEPSEFKLEDLPQVPASGLKGVTPLRKRPWTEKPFWVPFLALSKAKMASRFDKVSGHLMTETDEKAYLAPEGQEI